MLGYLCVTKKEKQRMNLKKIKIINGRIFSFSENSKTTNKLSSVKCVRDYGDFYDIVFPCFFFVSVYVCQKDLISKGYVKIIAKDKNQNSLDKEGNVIKEEEWKSNWKNNRYLINSNVNL
jgi:hypothetical protein